jgi:sec-independent protein translocase protein TatB
MFDFAWSEILLIGVVALIAIGPKDMPAAIRAVSGMMKKARRMASEFQTHVDEMVREADLGDVKKALTDIQRMDVPGAWEKHIDPDHTIRNAFQDNPLEAPTVTATPEPEPAAAKPVALAEPEGPQAPAFIPPGLVPKPAPPVAAVPEEAPAFIPPQAALQRRPRA